MVSEYWAEVGDIHTSFSEQSRENHSPIRIQMQMCLDYAN